MLLYAFLISFFSLWEELHRLHWPKVVHSTQDRQTNKTSLTGETFFFFFFLFLFLFLVLQG